MSFDQSPPWWADAWPGWRLSIWCSAVDTILRNYPIIGHLRFLLEGVGPELASTSSPDNDAERPFSRDQRRWVYTASKSTDRYFGFGTDNDFERVATTSSSSTRRSRCRPGRRSQPPRPGGAAARGQGARWVPTPGQGVPAVVGGQRLGHELRVALSGAAITALNKGRGHCRRAAHHGRGWGVALPSQWR